MTSSLAQKGTTNPTPFGALDAREAIAATTKLFPLDLSQPSSMYRLYAAAAAAAAAAVGADSTPTFASPLLFNAGENVRLGDATISHASYSEKLIKNAKLQVEVEDHHPSKISTTLQLSQKTSATDVPLMLSVGENSAFVRCGNAVSNTSNISSSSIPDTRLVPPFVQSSVMTTPIQRSCFVSSSPNLQSIFLTNGQNQNQPCTRNECVTFVTPSRASSAGVSHAASLNYASKSDREIDIIKQQPQKQHCKLQSQCISQELSSQPQSYISILNKSSLSKQADDEIRQSPTQLQFEPLKITVPFSQSNVSQSRASSSSPSLIYSQHGSSHKRLVPRKELVRDEAYWERRRKNNDAAKRSRDSRRKKEDEVTIRAALLEQENLRLRFEIEHLKCEVERHRVLAAADCSKNNHIFSKNNKTNIVTNFDDLNNNNGTMKNNNHRCEKSNNYMSL